MMTAADNARDPGAAAAGLLRVLQKLPPLTEIVFHGLTDIPDLKRARWTSGVTATSLDARIGTENFSTPVIAAILSRTGRDITAFSAHPAEREVVLPPEAMLHTLALDTALDGTTPLIIIEQLAELDPKVSLPPTLPEFVALVKERVAASMAEPPAKITTPGKFVEPLYFL
jgi:hypothetical protein